MLVNSVTSNHGHGTGQPGDPVDIEACVQGYGLFYKTIYDKANLLRGATATLGGPIADRQKTTVIMNCNCGSPMNYYGWSGVTRPVPGDVVGSRAVRNMVKSYRGFYDPSFPIAGDHMWLSKHRYGSNGGTTERPGPPDYITYLGIGAVYDTKYITDRYRVTLNLQDRMLGLQMRYPGQAEYTVAVGPTSGTNFNQVVNRTARYVYKWGDFIKYFGLYNDLMISKAEFMNLYKYGFDFPEGYAFKQDDNNYYYSFYSTIYGVGTGTGQGSIRNVSSAADPWGNGYYSTNNYSGIVELRGLSSGTAYYITDVVTGKQWYSPAVDGKITLDVNFTTGIVLKVSKNKTTSIFGNVYDGIAGAIIPGAALELQYADGLPVPGISRTAADLFGNYCFPLVPDGSYKIVATAYKDASGEVYPNVVADLLDDYETIPFTVSGGEFEYDIDMTATTPRVYVSGPESLYASDRTATYKFSLNVMPANTNAITLTFSVQDAFFTGNSLYALGDWQIIKESGWIQNDAIWKKTVSLIRAGESDAGNFDFYEIVLNVKEGVSGITEVAIVDILAATPGKTVSVVNTGPEVTDISTFSRYDVNQDGKVDLADVASGAYFYMVKNSDANWPVPQTFGDVSVSAQRCDVNNDGIVDIEDLILILANFS
jgi:hypothetical protein